MLITFCFGVSSNLSQEKSLTVEILDIYFFGTIVRRKYLPKIFAVGLFCCDKFEETLNEKVINMTKLTKTYFKHKGSTVRKSDLTTRKSPPSEFWSTVKL